ncbi:MAG: beta-lactamase family protein [Lachnospiraceae bacterium]|nr:beta-lactamase family protein [Lachnospiraceae bacterium]
MNYERLLEGCAQEIDAAGLEVLGIEIYRDGELRARHRWQEDTPVNIWSHTKCFTSAAVGLAVADGLLSLEDRIVDWFPEFAELPSAEGRLSRLTLRHVLTMSSGQQSKLLFGPLRDDPACQLSELRECEGKRTKDLLERILEEPFVEEPGTSFSYANSDADIAARCVEQAVGLTVKNYLYDRLFRPLDIEEPFWQSDLRGHTYGDAGLFLRTSDMVKLGLLYCQEGDWKGNTLLDASWIHESTGKQIDTPVRDPWDCGYGYLIWKFPVDDGYRFAGAGGQNSIVLPHRGLVIGINARVGARLPEFKQVLTKTLIEPLSA